MTSNRYVALALAGISTLAIGHASAARADDSDVGRGVFNQHCARCHNDKPAAGTTYGPSLVGVLGRKAGSVPGFAYSDALKGSGLVWTPESLKAWMANNDGMLPGTRMRHVGVTDAGEQEQIVAYLQTLTK